MLQGLIDQQRAQVRVGAREFAPVAARVAPGVEQSPCVGVPAERLGAGHRAAPGLEETRGEAEGASVEERCPVPPTNPLLPPASRRGVARGGLGRVRRAVGLLLEDRGDPGQVPGLLAQVGQVPKHLRVAGQQRKGALQEGLGPGEVRDLPGDPRSLPEQPRRAHAVRILPRLALEDRDRLNLLACPLVDGFARRMRGGRRAHRDGVHRTRPEVTRAIRRPVWEDVLMRREAGANRHPPWVAIPPSRGAISPADAWPSWRSPSRWGRRQPAQPPGVRGPSSSRGGSRWWFRWSLPTPPRNASKGSCSARSSPTDTGCSSSSTRRPSTPSG